MFIFRLLLSYLVSKFFFVSGCYNVDDFTETYFLPVYRWHLTPVKPPANPVCFRLRNWHLRVSLSVLAI